MGNYDDKSHAELDELLEPAGLSTSGNLEEKRARLAAHDATGEGEKVEAATGRESDVAEEAGVTSDDVACPVCGLIVGATDGYIRNHNRSTHHGEFVRTTVCPGADTSSSSGAGDRTDQLAEADDA
jgi:hypothetical protein